MFGGKPIRTREYLNDARGFIAEFLAKGMTAEQIAAPLTRHDWERLIDFLRHFGDLDPQFRSRLQALGTGAA